MLIQLLLNLEQGGVQRNPVCCMREKAELLWWSVHSELIFLSLLMERRPILPHNHMDTRIMKVEVQVNPRICKISVFWMLGLPHEASEFVYACWSLNTSEVSLAWKQRQESSSYWLCPSQ